ncbi:hypothetical protein HZS_8052 [Henneguya salminicola]|nr:hypothetical protein HZS_8052 [Henneguya salminicola]
MIMEFSILPEELTTVKNGIIEELVILPQCASQFGCIYFCYKSRILFFCSEKYKGTLENASAIVVSSIICMIHLKMSKT